MTNYYIHMYQLGSGKIEVAIVMRGDYDSVCEAGKALSAAMGFQFNYIEEVPQ